MSTHILPEVEQTCQQVLIINKGKLVATDSVNNLQNRARGAESLLVEVAGRKGDLDSAMVQRRLEQISGVSRVVLKEKVQNRAAFEVESHKDGFVRGDLARAIVESGWDLNELRPTAVSLEEIFLQLTGEPAAVASEERRCGRSRLDAKYLDHLPQRAEQLFRFAYRLSAADDVRAHLRVFLLELARLLRLLGMESQMRGQTLPDERE